MIVTLPTLRQQIETVLSRSGYDASEIPVITEILLYAQLRGNNQGIVKLTGKGMPKDVRAGEVRVIRETPLSLLLDGAHNLGMVVMAKGMEMALEKAQRSGFAILGIRNTASPTGAIGYYAHHIARAGLIGWIFSGSSPVVAPFGSKTPLFGTNPIAVGIPTTDAPVVLDMSTSSMAWYGIVQAMMAGETLPEHVAYDKAGNPATDPARALEGAIRPFGGDFSGHKGFGLSLVVEILTGPLVGAAFCGIGEGGWGNLLFIIDPALMANPDDFLEATSRLAQRVKAAEKLPGVDEIFLPGERGDRKAAQVLAAGEVEIEDNLYREFLKVASQKV